MMIALCPKHFPHPDWGMNEPEYLIESVAVIGKQSNPLIVKNYTDKPDLDVHYFINTALDSVDEKRIKKGILPPLIRSV